MSVMLSVIFIITMFAVPASAASGLKNAKLLKANNTVTLSASTKDTTYTYKIKLTGSGKVSFFKSSSNTNANTKMYLLDSNGKKLISKSFNDFVKLKVKVSKKGTYYLKIKLKKNQTIKSFGYKFTPNNGTASSKSDEWVKDYKLKQSDVDRIQGVLERWCLGYVDRYFFKEGDLTEEEAIKRTRSYSGDIMPYYTKDSISKYYENPWMTAENPYHDPLHKFEYYSYVDEETYDKLLYDMFGVKASHNYNSESGYYYNGGYYFQGYTGFGGVMGIEIEYISSEMLNDGRIIMKYDRVEYDYGSNGKKTISKREHIYTLIGLRKTNGNYYPRFYALGGSRGDII